MITTVRNEFKKLYQQLDKLFLFMGGVDLGSQLTWSWLAVGV